VNNSYPIIYTFCLISDVFGINEVTMFTGENSEKDYCVSGDIIDEVIFYFI